MPAGNGLFLGSDSQAALSGWAYYILCIHIVDIRDMILYGDTQHPFRSRLGARDFMAHSDPDRSGPENQTDAEPQVPSSPVNSRRQYSSIDRRSPIDRRQTHKLSYFEENGVERRKGRERRQQVREPRRGWVRVSDWTSAVVGRPFPPVASSVVYTIDGE